MVILIADQFPNDSSEWMDSDGDGVGDNADAFLMTLVKPLIPMAMELAIIPMNSLMTQAKLLIQMAMALVTMLTHSRQCFRNNRLRW